jgi:hypothetical protein
VGVTCSVYGPEWLSSVLAPVVRDLNAVVHDLHISLGTAPRFNVHHSVRGLVFLCERIEMGADMAVVLVLRLLFPSLSQVFLPLPLGLQSVSSHGLSFVPLARVLSWYRVAVCLMNSAGLRRLLLLLLFVLSHAVW